MRNHNTSLDSSPLRLKARKRPRRNIRIQRQFIRRRRINIRRSYTNRNSTLPLSTQRLDQMTIRMQNRLRRINHPNRLLLSLNNQRLLRTRPRNSIIPRTPIQRSHMTLRSRQRITPISQRMHSVTTTSNSKPQNKRFRTNSLTRRHNLTTTQQPRRRRRLTIKGIRQRIIINLFNTTKMSLSRIQSNSIDRKYSSIHPSNQH